MTYTFYLQIALAIFWLVLIPSMMGIVILRKNVEYTLLNSLVGGYILMFTAGELITLPLIYLRAPLTVLTVVMALFCLTAAVVGLVLVLLKKRTVHFPLKMGRGDWPSLYVLLAIAVIVLQMVTVVMLASTDADDSFYVATATTGVYSNTIFTINPYTGIPYETLPLRYVLSQFPTFLSVFSQLCLNLHPAIMAHTIFPPIFICILYAVQEMLSQQWFPEKKHARGMYLLFVALLLSCSAFSVYNAGVFGLTRIWQGKGFLASAFLPLLFLLNLDFFDEEGKYPWYWLFFTDLSCCYLSSMGIILATAVTGILAILYMIRSHKPARAGVAILCMFPSLILGALYVAMNMGEFVL